MRRKRPPYAAEFRAQMIELVGAGRTPEELSREFEPSAQAIPNWVAQADRDEGRRADGLTGDEREALRRLKGENRRLRRSGKSWQKPRPGSLGRPARYRPGLSLKELIRVIGLTRSLAVSHRPPLPAAFPGPLGRAHRAITRLSPGLRYYSAVRRLGPRVTSHFVFRLIGSFIPVPPGNPASPPGVTPRSSVTRAARKHRGHDGWVRTPSLP